MYLLKLVELMRQLSDERNLHSTMYLLKQTATDAATTATNNLHSTMYLLKHVVLNDIILIS